LDNIPGTINDANHNINDRYTKNNNDNTNDNTNSNSDNKYTNAAVRESKEISHKHSDMVLGCIETSRHIKKNDDHDDKEEVVNITNENNIDKNESSEDTINDNLSADNNPCKYKNNFANDKNYNDQDECPSGNSRKDGINSGSNNDNNDNFVNDNNNSKYNSACDFLSKNSIKKVIIKK